MFLADSASSYISKKAVGMLIEPDERYSIPVTNINYVEPCPNINVLKKELGEIKRLSHPWMTVSTKFQNKKTQRKKLIFWRNENELKQNNQSFEDKYNEVEDDILCNRKKHKPYLDIDYEVLKNFNIVGSDDEDAAGFSMINPVLLDLDLEDSDGVRNNAVAPTMIDYLLILNEQFYGLCLQSNGLQQNLFNFIKQYAVHCKLAEKNNELQPKPFQIFLKGGARVGFF